MVITTTPWGIMWAIVVGVIVVPIYTQWGMVSGILATMGVLIVTALLVWLWWRRDQR